MNYVLYFASLSNDTYFYDTLNELLNDWDCLTLEEFKNYYKNDRYYILHIDEIILRGEN